MSKMLAGIFGSRKFTIAIAGFLVAIFKDKLGITVSEETVQWGLGLLAVVIGGEAYKDAQGAANGAGAVVK